MALVVYLHLASRMLHCDGIWRGKVCHITSHVLRPLIALVPPLLRTLHLPANDIALHYIVALHTIVIHYKLRWGTAHPDQNKVSAHPWSRGIIIEHVKPIMCL